MKHLGFGSASAVVLVGAVVTFAACSANSVPVAPTDGGTNATCGADLAKDEYCKSCTVSPNASPAACKPPRTVEACCTFVQEPTAELKRAVGLHRFSTDSDPKVDLGCLDTPEPQGQSQTVTINGFVRFFSSGNDSAGVKVEIFREGPDGTLGDPVGTPAVTTSDDALNPPLTPKPEWLKKCPVGGCTFRSYVYAGVPTETPLVFRTSDATGGALWTSFYDYNVYIKNSIVKDGIAKYDTTAVASTDIGIVAAAAGGSTVPPDRGVLAGEVHDCGDIRLSGATVDTDIAHEGDLMYFGENESEPLPDRSRGALGTSQLGLFGALNMKPGTPVRVRAIGKLNGELVLIGSHTVQIYPNSVTALAFRGRRPYQK